MTDQLTRAELSKITGAPKTDIYLCIEDAPIWFKIQGYKGSFFAGTVSQIQRQAGFLVGSVSVGMGGRLYHGVVFYDESERIWRLSKIDPTDTDAAKEIHPELAAPIT